MGAIDRLDRLTSDRCDVRAILAAIGGGSVEKVGDIALALEQVPVGKEFEEGKRILETLKGAICDAFDKLADLDDKIERVGPEAERENEQIAAEQIRDYKRDVRWKGR